jgi:hypothetical protein
MMRFCTEVVNRPTPHTKEVSLEKVVILTVLEMAVQEQPPASLEPKQAPQTLEIQAVSAKQRHQPIKVVTQ